MAQGFHGFRVGERGLNHQPDARFGQQQGHRHQHGNGHGHHEAPVNGELCAIQREQRAAQFFGHAVVHRAAAPHQLHQFQNDVAQAESDQQLRHMAEFVHPAQRVFFKQRSQHPHHQRGHHQRGPETHHLRDGVGQVGPQHVERGVREIEHAHHAENERQPGAEHEQQQPVADPVQQGYGKKFHGDVGCWEQKTNKKARLSQARRAWCRAWGVAKRAALTLDRLKDASCRSWWACWPRTTRCISPGQRCSRFFPRCT